MVLSLLVHVWLLLWSRYLVIRSLLQPVIYHSHNWLFLLARWCWDTQKLNIIVPIIISSHLPHCCPPSRQAAPLSTPLPLPSNSTSWQWWRLQTLTLITSVRSHIKILQWVHVWIYYNITLPIILILVVKSLNQIKSWDVRDMSYVGSSTF